MADQVFNIALGRVAEYFHRVDSNDPSTAQFVILAIESTNGSIDALAKDVDDVAELLALASTAECTNTNYARKTITDADITGLPDPDSGDAYSLTFTTPNQTWNSVAAGSAGVGENWTHLIIAYDAAQGGDAAMIPMTMHDFAVTPNGGNVTAQIASGFYGAS